MDTGPAGNWRSFVFGSAPVFELMARMARQFPGLIGMYDIVNTLTRHADTLPFQSPWYLSWRPLLLDDGLFYSPYQLRGKCSIGYGTLSTLHSLVMGFKPNILIWWVLLRFNSRESVDWLMPTIWAISFLGLFLWSKEKICDLCSEVNCLYILYITIQR